MFLARPYSLELLIVIALVSSSALVAKAQEDCAEGSDREQLACLSSKIDTAKQELQKVYQAALAKMPENDSSERRRNKDQLVQAQTAWQAYVKVNCAYVGGTEGVAIFG